MRRVDLTLSQGQDSMLNQRGALLVSYAGLQKQQQQKKKETKKKLMFIYN